MIKSVLLMKSGSGCICDAKIIIKRSTVLCSFNDFITLANAISKLPEDRSEVPKHVGAFVM
jgi:hypothetical protein